MCGSSAPAPPDPVVTANAQTQSNIQTANNNATLNRVNQYTPYGNLNYSIDGYADSGTPQYSATVQLSPQEQQIFNNQMAGQINQGNIATGMQGQVANSYANPIDISGAPGIASRVTGSGPAITGTVMGQQDIGKAVQDAQDATYKGITQYLDPQYDQRQKSLENSLINQGITQGSEADTNAKTLFNNERQQAYSDASRQAVLAGQNEQNTLFGQGVQASNLQNAANQQNFSQGLTNANLQNSANTQYLQNIFALRNQPLNEYNALMTGAQVQSPNFVNVPGVNQAGTDVAGITNSAYQNQLAQWQANQAGINNLMSLGGSLGAAAIMSDRRVKRDIRRLGETPGGIPIYSFNYVWDDATAGPYIGVMADEVAPVIPDAVVYGDDGFARVDYSKVR